MYPTSQLVLTVLKNGCYFIMLWRMWKLNPPTLFWQFDSEAADSCCLQFNSRFPLWSSAMQTLHFSRLLFLMGNLTSISPALASRHSISVNIIRHKSGCVCPGIATNNKQSLWSFTSFWNHTSLWAESDERLSFGRHLFLLFPYFDHNLMVQNKDLL